MQRALNCCNFSASANRKLRIYSTQLCLPPCDKPTTGSRMQLPTSSGTPTNGSPAAAGATPNRPPPLLKHDSAHQLDPHATLLAALPAPLSPDMRGSSSQLASPVNASFGAPTSRRAHAPSVISRASSFTASPRGPVHVRPAAQRTAVVSMDGSPVHANSVVAPIAARSVCSNRSLRTRTSSLSKRGSTTQLPHRVVRRDAIGGVFDDRNAVDMRGSFGAQLVSPDGTPMRTATNGDRVSPLARHTPSSPSANSGNELINNRGVPRDAGAALVLTNRTAFGVLESASGVIAAVSLAASMILGALAFLAPQQRRDGAGVTMPPDTNEADQDVPRTPPPAPTDFRLLAMIAFATSITAFTIFFALMYRRRLAARRLRKEYSEQAGLHVQKLGRRAAAASQAGMAPLSKQALEALAASGDQGGVGADKLQGDADRDLGLGDRRETASSIVVPEKSADTNGLGDDVTELDATFRSSTTEGPRRRRGDVGP